MTDNVNSIKPGAATVGKASLNAQKQGKVNTNQNTLEQSSILAQVKGNVNADNSVDKNEILDLAKPLLKGAATGALLGMLNDISLINIKSKTDIIKVNKQIEDQLENLSAKFEDLVHMEGAISQAISLDSYDPKVLDYNEETKERNPGVEEFQ